MSEKNPADCSGEDCSTDACCQVEAVLSVDERGQMVLPKALRTRLGIEPGDKLAAVTMEREGGACCITLMKVDDIAPMVRKFLGPILADVFGDKEAS